MRHSLLVAAVLLLNSQAAGAQNASWAMFSFQTEPQHVAKVIALTDKLMSSEAGQQFPGRLLLQNNLANGSDPATHSIVPIYRSVAEREAFLQKLQADSAWSKFQKKFAKVSDPVSQVLYRTVKNWGEIADSDRVWMAHAFQVRDPGAFLAAIDRLMASSTGQKFPGQVYLSSVVAGGVSPVSHLISVGYASEVEMEAWRKQRDGSRDWASYLEASGKVSDYLGGSLARTVKTWGASGLANLVSR